MHSIPELIQIITTRPQVEPYSPTHKEIEAAKKELQERWDSLMARLACLESTVNERL